MQKLTTKSREEQIQAADVIGDFARSKLDRDGTTVAWERTDEGKILVVFAPEAKVEPCQCDATLLGRLKGLVADLEKQVEQAKKSEGSGSGNKSTTRNSK